MQYLIISNRSCSAIYRQILAHTSCLTHDSLNRLLAAPDWDDLGKSLRVLNSRRLWHAACCVSPFCIVALTTAARHPSVPVTSAWPNHVHYPSQIPRKLSGTRPHRHHYIGTIYRPTDSVSHVTKISASCALPSHPLLLNWSDAARKQLSLIHNPESGFLVPCVRGLCVFVISTKGAGGTGGAWAAFWAPSPLNEKIAVFSDVAAHGAVVFRVVVVHIIVLVHPVVIYIVAVIHVAVDTSVCLATCKQY